MLKRPDMIIFVVGLASSFGAGGLLQDLGWQWMNALLLPWLGCAAALLVWFGVSAQRAEAR
ncbi:hypothetical protein M8A51_24665 [Schlegelella sp. S2-27]|uniref:Major facilitator superfamily (MFS) profile domain-containing protein n=1 Tax=Caldimonas mangrovi TaxID=2944811 RepID=A0ABT0YVX4_9BURK|nr:hypothetical protein [Caldimonas mangrovi]MCM5682738.1 hypothetical protein [Caldimonas mangrovi]